MLFNLYMDRETNTLVEIMVQEGKILLRGEDYLPFVITSSEFKKYAFIGTVYTSFPIKGPCTLLKVHKSYGEETLQLIGKGVIAFNAIAEGIPVQLESKMTWYCTSNVKSVIKSDEGKTYDIYTLNSHYRVVFP